MSGKTPYNSIYEAVSGGGCPNGEQEDGTVVCCAHGVKCDSNAPEKKEKSEILQPQTDESGEEEGLYINLVDHEEGEKTRKRLEGLNLINKAKKEKKRNDKNAEVRLGKLKNEKCGEKTDASSRKSEKSKKQRKRDGSAKRKEGRRKRSTKSKKSQKSAKEENYVANAYLGAMTFEEAEATVPGKTEFRLYHRIESRKIIDELTEEATLHLVYRTVHGDYRHYPIRQRTSGDKKLFYVDYGDPRALAQSSLEELIRFYKKNTEMHARNTDIAHQNKMC